MSIITFDPIHYFLAKFNIALPIIKVLNYRGIKCMEVPYLNTTYNMYINTLNDIKKINNDILNKIELMHYHEIYHGNLNGNTILLKINEAKHVKIYFTNFSNSIRISDIDEKYIKSQEDFIRPYRHFSTIQDMLNNECDLFKSNYF